MILYEATIRTEPMTKKNTQKIIRNRKTGKFQIVQGDTFRQYETDAARFLKFIPKAIEEPVEVVYKFYRSNNRRVDLTNLEAAMDDILVNAGILKDDSFKYLVSHDGSRVLVDPENPRTEIKIQTIDY